MLTKHIIFKYIYLVNIILYNFIYFKPIYSIIFIWFYYLWLNSLPKDNAFRSSTKLYNNLFNVQSKVVSVTIAVSGLFILIFFKLSKNEFIFTLGILLNTTALFEIPSSQSEYILFSSASLINLFPLLLSKKIQSLTPIQPQIFFI